MSLRIAIVIVAGALLASRPARAERPDAWLFRASPGWGYSWDRASSCAVDGRMFVGGWQIGKMVTPSVLVGGRLTVGFNTLPEDGCPLDGDGLRLALGMVIGPAVEWYPFDSFFHVAASAGYANFDQDSMLTTHGVGGTLEIGHDWRWLDLKDGNDARLGVALQVTAVRMTEGHALIMPALVMTLGVD